MDMLRKVIVLIPVAKLHELIGIGDWSDSMFQSEMRMDGEYLEIKVRSPALPKVFETPPGNQITHISLERMRIITGKESS